ncbi:class C beta-lactamase [Aeromonas diversa]|uniref:class C beta-lactamase n=1 Tax=Aeromonas diversa TaxID=502790 RepID=UPI0034618FCD
MKQMTLRHTGLALLLTSLCGGALAAEGDALKRAVDGAVRPLMKEHRIPGMAVAVLADGRMNFFNYGVTSLADPRPVTKGTLFELGSVSKTFTGLLGAYLVAEGRFAYDDPVSRHMPALAGSAFDRITMVQAATYSAGGLPLQFPDAVQDEAGMLAYFRDWKPGHPAGSVRQYSNPSIGLFGNVAARSAGAPFATLMEQTLLPRLGLSDTYLTVPAAAMGRYAFGHSAEDQTVRVSPGMFDAEAYGIKSSSADLLRYLEAFGRAPADPALGKAMVDVQQPRYRVGPMQQGLGWEVYSYPVSRQDLLAGNAREVSFGVQPTGPVTPIEGSRLINKTGSTGGFGAYLLAVPERGIGIVLLANRNYPIPARVDTAYTILEAVQGKQP